MSSSRARPHLLVFLTDQQRFDTTGVHGNPLGLTPSFDALARRGTWFQHAFTPNPLCAPARAAIQSGRFPTAVGCHRNGRALPPSIPTLAGSLARHGYRTGYIGKWHLASAEPVPRDERAGYEHWLAANVLERTSQPYDTSLFDADGNSVRLPGYRSDALVDAAIRHLDRALREDRDRPLFLFVSLLEPHQQNDRDAFVCPVGYERYGAGWMPEDLERLVGSSRQQLPGYLGSVKRVDEGLARLLDALISLGVDDRTDVVVTSDHGCHFRTRNDEYKRSCHEASIRVPLAAQGPSFDGRGVVSDLASLLDVPVMLLDAAGAEPEQAFEGRHLGDRAARAQNRLVPPGGSTAAAGEHSVLVQLSESQTGRALRTRRWKYCVAAAGDEGTDTGCAGEYSETHLYDLENDPAELANLVAEPDYEGIRASLRSELSAWLGATGEGRATIRAGR